MNLFRIVALALLLSFFARDAAACAPNWVAGTNGILTSWRSPATGDFNGDGRTDLVGFSSADVYVSITTAGGAFGTQASIGQGTSLYDIAVADVQNDGKLDVIASDTGTNKLLVFPGNGNGTFVGAVATQLPVSAKRILVRDFTGDGKADVAFRSETAGVIGVWKGDGANGFTELGSTAVAGYSDAFGAADFDGDGFGDLVVPMTAPRVDVWFGNGDGTFDAPVQLTGGNYAYQVAVADVDHDGDPDFATSNRTDETMTVFRNTGSRTFIVETYVLNPEGLEVFSSGLVLADVTQDGYADAVIAQEKYRRLATLVNNGNGTFRAPIFAAVPPNPFTFSGSFRTVLAGQFSSDERVDVVAKDSSTGYVVLFPNNCGESSVTTQLLTPLISVGQEASVLVHVSGPGLATTPTGTVRVFEGDTELAQAELDDDAYAALSVPGLAAGDHVLTAHYDGDEVFDPRDASPVTQRVTSEATQVTLAVTPDDGNSEFGEDLSIRTRINGTSGESGITTYTLLLNGVEKTSGYSDTFSLHELAPGTYELQVQYSGNTDFAPGTSSVYKHVVTRSRVMRPEASPSLDQLIAVGATTSVAVVLRGVHAPSIKPTGSVTLVEGTQQYGTLPLSEGGTELPLPQLTVGTHYLQYTYSGDANFLPFRSEVFRITVIPQGTFFLGASASGTTVFVQWAEYPNAAFYMLQRLVNHQWQDVVMKWSNDRSHQQVLPDGGPSFWRVRAHDGNSVLLGTSIIDMAMSVAFTDDPLLGGATKIKAAHVTELVSAINTLRAASALAPISLSNITPGKTMNAIDIQTLRNAVNDARTNLGMPSFAFPDILTAKSTRIKAAHVQEIRDLLR